MKKIKFFWLLILLLAACHDAPVKHTGEETTRVRVVRIAPGGISVPVHTSGILASSDEMKLSFKTGGIVAKISVREGDKVKKGDILASLNLSEITANVNLAKNGYEKAYRDWNRVKNLYSDTVATLEQYQNATTAVEIAKSNLEIARFNFAHSTINAPDDGVILKQLVKENEIVSAGYPVFLFGSTGKYWKVRCGLPDRDIVRVNPGDSASVKLDTYPGINFSAFVEQVSEMSNPMTGTYETELNLNGMGRRLASGFIAAVDIYPEEMEKFIKLPVGAVVDADGKEGFVYAVNDSGAAVKYKIEIKAISGSEVAVRGIPAGINEVVSEGTAYLRDGMRVKIIR
jgi:multidrug efflux system membrane fusion protein